MKKNIVMIIMLTLLMFPFGVLAEEKEEFDKSSYKTENLEEVLTREGLEHDLTSYKETDDQATIYLFYGDGCAYCKKFLTFLNSIVGEYGDYFKVEAYETWNDSNNSQLMKKVAKAMKKTADGVPFIVIGDQTFTGYSEDSNDAIKKAIMDLYNSEERYDVFEHLDSNTSDGLIVVLIFGFLILGIGGLVYLSRKK